MFIQEIKIRNILACKSAHLRFDKCRNSVYIVQSDFDCPARQVFSTAVQLIFSTKFVSLQSLKQLNDIYKGSVHIMFWVAKRSMWDQHISTTSTLDDAGVLTASEGSVHDNNDDCEVPCTTQQAKLDEERRRRRSPRQHYFDRQNIATKIQQYHKVNVLRNFQIDPECIEYNIDGGPSSKMLLLHFHTRFFGDGSNIEYLLPQLQPPSMNCNWLRLLSTNLNEKWNNDVITENNLFDQFARLFRGAQKNRIDGLSKLTKKCLTSNIALSVLQKMQLFKLFRDIRSIFEFITFAEYTVWFLIPFMGKLFDITNFKTLEINVDSILTCIQLKSASACDRKCFIWTEAERAIKDLLLVAMQLALAFHCKQNVIYLQKMDAIKDYQAIQLATAAYVQKYRNAEKDWCNRNYLQRIIDVCNKLYIVAIIEFPGGLPLPPKNAHLIKCFATDEQTDWELRVFENNSVCSLDNIMDCIEQSVKFS